MVNTSTRTVGKPTGHHAGVIFHIADRDRWLAAQADGQYTASTLDRELADEGFIHLSTAAQLQGVLQRFYVGVPNLVLLHVDEALLTAPLRYEVVADVPEPFPHLYGPLNTDAVIQVDEMTSSDEAHEAEEAD
jgi:uncharacterized protein (DUF952 family)